MFCTSCGKELPHDVRFCVRCGRPKELNTVIEKDIWEICEIQYDTIRDGLFGSDMQFWADAIHPSNGTYSAGKSEVFGGVTYPDSKKLKHGQVHNRFVDKLVLDGWEPIPSRGSNWWQKRFRRRININ